MYQTNGVHVCRPRQQLSPFSSRPVRTVDSFGDLPEYVLDVLVPEWIDSREPQSTGEADGKEGHAQIRCHGTNPKPSQGSKQPVQDISTSVPQNSRSRPTCWPHNARGLNARTPVPLASPRLFLAVGNRISSTRQPSRLVRAPGTPQTIVRHPPVLLLKLRPATVTLQTVPRAGFTHIHLVSRAPFHGVCSTSATRVVSSQIRSYFVSMALMPSRSTPLLQYGIGCSVSGFPRDTTHSPRPSV